MTKLSLALGICAIFLTGVLGGLLLARSDLAPRLAPNSAAGKVDEVLSLIRHMYIDPPDDEQLVEGAIRGMTELLDPYSIYVDRQQLPSIREDIDGNFGGVGLWFEMVSDTARVVSVVSGGPSDKSGILPGDRIIAINDSSAVAVPSLVVQNKIKGRRGTSVRLTLYRPAIERQIVFEIVRDVIPVRSIVASFMLDDSTAYVRLARFTGETAAEFRTAIGKLRSATPARLLLDLRDNPGGLLQAAVELSDELLPAGTSIVTTEGKDGKAIDDFRSTSGGSAETIPLVVLVNQNSASASEIVAGAIQDNDRGLVVGNPTFGKGRVQSQFLFSDGTALHLTIARYHTPAGRPIENNLTRSYAGSGLAGREQAVTPADSLATFTTVHGRTVRGGLGIYPDKVFEISDRVGQYFRFVFQSGLDMSFTRSWFNEHERELRNRWGSRQADFVRAFRMTSTQWEAFNRHVQSEAAEAARHFTARDIEESRSRGMVLLKGRLGQLLYGPSVWQPIVSTIDPEIAFANSFWREATALPGI